MKRRMYIMPHAEVIVAEESVMADIQSQVIDGSIEGVDDFDGGYGGEGGEGIDPDAKGNTNWDMWE